MKKIILLVILFSCVFMELGTASIHSFYEQKNACGTMHDLLQPDNEIFIVDNQNNSNKYLGICKNCSKNIAKTLHIKALPTNKPNTSASQISPIVPGLSFDYYLGYHQDRLEAEYLSCKRSTSKKTLKPHKNNGEQDISAEFQITTFEEHEPNCNLRENAFDFYYDEYFSFRTGTRKNVLTDNAHLSEDEFINICLTEMNHPFQTSSQRLWDYLTRISSAKSASASTQTCLVCGPQYMYLQK